MMRKLASVIRPVLHFLGVHRVVAFMDRIVGRPLRSSLRKDYGFVMDREDIGSEGPAESPARVSAGGPRGLVINWFCWDVFKGSGGHTTMFRVMRHLEKKGHRLRLYIDGGSVFKNDAALTGFVNSNFFGLEAEMHVKVEDVKPSDATFATYWKTAYTVRRIRNTKKRFYLVQDYEPYFTPHCSDYFMAENTYKFGYYGITVGSWLSEKLSGEYGMPCTPFFMSYDKDFYGPDGRAASDRKRVLFYSQANKPRRGFEMGMLALEELKRTMPEVEIMTVGGEFPGAKKTFEYTDLGVLSYEGLARAYKMSDVALVISFTNLSLLPLELMASKCAVVSNRGRNAEWMLKDGVNCVLSDSDPYALAENIRALLVDDAKRGEIVEKGYRYAVDTSWDDELDKVEAAVSAAMKDF